MGGRALPQREHGQPRRVIEAVSRRHLRPAAVGVTPETCRGAAPPERAPARARKGTGTCSPDDRPRDRSALRAGGAGSPDPGRAEWGRTTATGTATCLARQRIGPDRTWANVRACAALIARSCRVAVGRSILVTIWALPCDHETQFADLGGDYSATRTDPERTVRQHVRGLQALGYSVTLDHAAGPGHRGFWGQVAPAASAAGWCALLTETATTLTRAGRRRMSARPVAGSGSRMSTTARSNGTVVFCAGTAGPRAARR